MAASNSIRLRRTLRAISSLHRSFSSSAATSAPPISLAIRRALPSAPPAPAPAPWLSRSFRSSSISLWSNISLSASNIPDEIDPDDILLEGCDYHHWLFSISSSASDIPDEIEPDDILSEGCDYHHWLFGMDFPGDNKPSPEEMVRTYEETCAKGLGISVAEAKQKIYACSTTNYTGFQAVMSEEESRKFENLPGVIFVLPDCYIDPVNKEYGGDKYINGTIIPRPPPIQYGRNTGRRPHQDNQMSSHQGNPSYNNRGPMQGDGRNYGQASQNYPRQQNYGQASQNYPPQRNSGQPPQNYPPQQNYGQPSQNYGQASQNYDPQQNYSQAPQNYGRSPESYPPQQNFGQAPQNHPQQQTYGSASQQRYGPASPQYPQQQSYGSPGQGDSRNYVPQQNFGPPGQGERRGTVPQQNFGPPGQGERRDQVPRDSALRNDTFTPSYMKDFKPSYMQEFENIEQGNYPPKEQAGSQQRNPTPGHGNFTGEVW